MLWHPSTTKCKRLYFKWTESNSAAL